MVAAGLLLVEVTVAALTETGPVRKEPAGPTNVGAADGNVYAPLLLPLLLLLAEAMGMDTPLMRSVDITANVAIEVLENFKFSIQLGAFVLFKQC